MLRVCISVVVVLTLGLSAYGATINVPGNYPTIQAAINAASAGDTIVVAAGTYSEVLSINKSLTLQGANANVDPNTGTRGTESVLDFSGVSGNPLIAITATGTVVIDGFKIVDNNTAGGRSAIRITAVTTHAIKNCIFERAASGSPGITRGVEISPSSSGGVSITANLFVGIGLSDLFSHRTWTSAIYSNGGGTATSVTNNVFRYCRTAINLDDYTSAQTIVGNTFDQNGTALSFGGVSPTTGAFTIAGNSFVAATPSTHINLSNVASAFLLDVTGNTFEGSSTSAMSQNDLYTLEYRMVHRFNVGKNGLVLFKSNNVYVVPPLTGLSPQKKGLVQEGVDAASAGWTVNVAPGTFEGQVEIARSLTLRGEGATFTTIKAPTMLTKKFITGVSTNNFPVVYVHDAADAVVRDLTVDGAGRGNGNYRFIGVGYRNAGGTVEGCTVKDIRETPISGTQHGVAIYAFADNGTDRILNVNNNLLTGFQKNGTAFNGANLTVTATGNTVVGAGPVGFIAQNGIQLSFAATGAITNNAVSGIAYTGSGWSATGILLYDASATVMTGGNTVTNAMVGIWYINSQGSATDNTVTYSQTGMGSTSYWWGIVADPGEGSTRQPPPAFFASDSSSSRPVGNAGKERGGMNPFSSLTISINANHVDGGGSGTGIEADALGSEVLDFIAEENCVTNCAVGFSLYNEGTATLNASVNRNSIVGNVVGLENASTSPQNAENNWWGDTDGSGPFHATLNTTGTGDSVVGAVDFIPWNGAVAVSTGPDQALYIGYGPTSTTLTAGVSGGALPYTYLWSTGATTPSITVSTSMGVGTYSFSVNVTDVTRCNSGSDTINVTIEDVRCGSNLDKVALYHRTANGRYHWICVAPSSVPAHLAHGDVFTLPRPAATINEVPEQFALKQNFPNPFNPSTAIAYDLPVDAHVSIEVYSVLGQKVAQLVDENLTAGYHNVTFDATSLASGIYIYRMTAQGFRGEHFVQVRKMMVIK